MCGKGHAGEKDRGSKSVRAVARLRGDGPRPGRREAAQIAFFATLSFIPLAMLLVGGFGFFFEDEEIRTRVVQVVFDNVPLAQESDRERLERVVDDALDNTGRLGPVSVVLLIVAASGVMGALRHAITRGTLERYFEYPADFGALYGSLGAWSRAPDADSDIRRKLRKEGSRFRSHLPMK